MCTENSLSEEIIMVMSNKRLGTVCVMDEKFEDMVGIITEGDVRRALSRKNEFFNLKASDIMTRNYTKVQEDKLAIDALELMENRTSQISVLPVFRDDKLVGVVRIHDLLNVVG